MEILTVYFEHLLMKFFSIKFRRLNYQSVITLMIICTIFNCKDAMEEIKYIDKEIIVGHIEDENLIYTNWKKNVVIENFKTGDTIFIYKTVDINNVMPITRKTHIYFKNSDSDFKCVDFKANIPIWSVNTPNKIKNFIVLNDSIGLLDIKNFGLVALNLLNGKKVFNIDYEYGRDGCNVPDMSPYPIIFDKDFFYINNFLCRTIRAYDVNNGKEVWSRELGKGMSQSIIVDDQIFIGMNNAYTSGNIYLLDKKSGDIKHQQIIPFEERMKVVEWNNKIIFYDYKANCLQEFDLVKKEIKTLKTSEGTNDITGQLFLLNNNLYYQNNNFEIVKFDLISYKEKVLIKSKKGGISGMGFNSFNDEVVYW